ncbi:MAG: FHA domain-containing protein [Myxococcota bacterium]
MSGPASNTYRVLIIDWDTTHTQVLQDFLLTRNITVVTATDGKSAWTEFTRSAPDVVLMEVELKKLPATDLLNMIRAHLMRSATPVLLMSSTLRTERDEEELAAKLKVEGALRKPVAPRELMRRMDDVVAKRRRRPESAAPAGPSRTESRMPAVTAPPARPRGEGFGTPVTAPGSPRRGAFDTPPTVPGGPGAPKLVTSPPPPAPARNMTPQPIEFGTPTTAPGRRSAAAPPAPTTPPRLEHRAVYSGSSLSGAVDVMPGSERPPPAPVVDESTSRNPSPPPAPVEEPAPLDALSSFVLQFLAGPYVGREFPLSRGATATVGRSPDTEIFLDDNMVSRRQATISVEGSGVMLKDLGSTNGTYVNGQRVTEHRLQHGDKIVIGNSMMRFACNVEVDVDV